MNDRRANSTRSFMPSLDPTCILRLPSLQSLSKPDRRSSAYERDESVQREVAGNLDPRLAEGRVRRPPASAPGGDGPLDALFRTIQEITGTSVTVRDFRVHSVTRGTDAQGESTIEVERNGRVYRGRGVSTDTVEAATLAFLNAVNRAEAGVGQPAQPTPHDVV